MMTYRKISYKILIKGDISHEGETESESIKT